MENIKYVKKVQTLIKSVLNGLSLHRCSGVNINNVSPSKSYRILLMVAGAIGMSGANALDNVAAAFLFKADSVIIRHQRMVARFVWVNEFDTKYAIRNCVLKMNLLLGHSNVPCITMKRLRGNSISGKLILTVVSAERMFVIATSY